MTRASGTASRSNSPTPFPHDDHRYLIAQWKREIDPGRRGRFQSVPGAAAEQRQAVRHRRDQLSSRRARRSAEGTPAGCAAGETPVWLRPETNQMRALVATDGRLGTGGRRALQRLHRRITRHRPRQQAADAGFGLDRFRHLSPSQAPTAPAISRFSPTANGSSRSRAISAMPTRASARTSISSSDPTGPRTRPNGRSTTTISAARRTAPMCWRRRPARRRSPSWSQRRRRHLMQ